MANQNPTAAFQTLEEAVFPASCPECGCTEVRIVSAAFHDDWGFEQASAGVSLQGACAHRFTLVIETRNDANGVTELRMRLIN